MPVTSRQRPTRPARPARPRGPAASRATGAPRCHLPHPAGTGPQALLADLGVAVLPAARHRRPLSVDPVTGERGWVIEATIDLVEGSPALTRMNVHVPGGLDPYLLQREFRCASPVEVVRVGGLLLARGIDPFDHDLPLWGFPEAATLAGPASERLTDGFLEDIAREYLLIGRGLRPGDRRRAGRHRTHRPKPGRHRADRPPGSI